MIGLRSASSLAVRRAWLWRNRNDSGGSDAVSRGPRLLADVSGIIQHDARTGIQRVVRALWLQLQSRQSRGFELVPVYASKTHGYCYAPPDFLSRSNLDEPAPVSVTAEDQFLGLDLSAHLLPNYVSQLRAWRHRGATLNLMVYDLLPLLRPEWFTAAAVRHFRRWYSVLQSEVDQAICISGAVADQLRGLVQRAGRGVPLITHIPMGSDWEGSLPTSGVGRDVTNILEALGSRPAILMVGTVEPRKGYDVALRAFEHLWQNFPLDAPNLVIAGKPGWKTETLQQKIRSHPEQGRRLHWLKAVTDEELGLLYDSCNGLLVASYAEGFGLPLLEAAKHGRPVLARDVPVFREQSLPSVAYFNDDSPESLGAAILGITRASRWSRTAIDWTLPKWSDSAEELLRQLGLAGYPSGAGAASIRAFA